ncbi:hypothetical protein Tco_0506428 [Tanacetum coccineum]
METEAIDNQDYLVNYDNENEYEIEDLGYESEEYTEDAHEDDENNHSNGYAKRGITRLCKFRKEYGKPGGVKLSVTFDALNRISGKHRALLSSFLGDMVREHIGLQILSWKKVGPEARNKLWDEITRYFDVDLTVRKQPDQVNLLCVLDVNISPSPGKLQNELLQYLVLLIYEVTPSDIQHSAAYSDLRVLQVT